MTASAIALHIVVLGNACLLISLICVADVLVRVGTVRILRRHS